MTTGCDGGTNFCPGRGVSRGENITFAKRYDDLVVQPALDGIRAEIAANPGPQGPAGADGAAGVDAESPARVVWVADDGTGDFLLLSTALASIVDAAVDKPYVVRIAPGVYTETATVTLKTYVDVEGSGQGVTTIACACAKGSTSALSATVSAGNIVAEIRHLTINNTGGDTRTIGVWTEEVVDGSVSMSDVTATATGGTDRNYGVYNKSSSSPSMMNVTATATGGTNSIGVANDSSSSPSMTDVTATATGGTGYNYGVFNWSSSPSMTDVTATATGGTNTVGVYNSSPSMTDVTATATDGTTNAGVYNDVSSSPSMTDVTATATDGTTSFGVLNESSSSPSIRNSSITGDNFSIYNSGTTAQVADTMLNGPVAAGNGLTCTGVYTAAFVALNIACVP
jgi:hypothetical protein